MATKTKKTKKTKSATLRRQPPIFRRITKDIVLNEFVRPGRPGLYLCYCKVNPNDDQEWAVKYDCLPYKERAARFMDLSDPVNQCVAESGLDRTALEFLIRHFKNQTGQWVEPHFYCIDDGQMSRQRGWAEELGGDL